MKILLTGASGFVGSHILDELRARGYPVAVLLRPTSNRRFIQHQLDAVEVCDGSISDPAGLRKILAGMTHVIHCAGATRAAQTQDYYRTNHIGTQNVIEAIRTQGGTVQRLIHISSLAVSGPATASNPAREDGPTNPISDYGKSKLAAEEEVRKNCPSDFVIVRPPAVYGPRDDGFLSLFKAVQRHLLPLPSESQALSLVFVKDLARAVAELVNRPQAKGQTYFINSSEVVTARQMAKTIASEVGHWTVPLPLPPVAFLPLCLVNEGICRIFGKAQLLNLQKYAELRAPGWVCDSTKLSRETGLHCPTNLKAGVAETLKWYRKEGWL
jgi:nucleoside-diphosphate-sugar epimerase